MKSLRRAALVALALVSAVVVVASPAFATPRLTTSTGTVPDGGAVRPFVTPIGDTLTSSITISQTFAARAGFSVASTALDRTASTVTCVRLTASGHAFATHTRISISSFHLDGCRTDGTNLVVHASSLGINTSTPMKIHITSIDGAIPTSSNGTLEIPPGAGLSFSIKSGAVTVCTETVIPQSLRLRLTTRNRTIELSDPTVRYGLDRGFLFAGCPDPSRTARFDSVTAIRYTTDTPGTSLTVTVLSR
jgi:hypothetical protein